MDPVQFAIERERTSSNIEYNLILWTDKNINKIVGVTLDKVKNHNVSNRPLLHYLVHKVSSKGVPIILVEHDFSNNDIQVINAHKNKDKKFSLNTHELESLILSEFNINGKNNNSAIKSVNVNERVYDGFHTWSRNTFGSSVKKCDVDSLLFDGKSITCTIEIKNTARSGIKVTTWQPYPADKDNYRIVGLFSNQILDCNFITLHHNIPMNEKPNTKDINVGLWMYRLEESFDSFRAPNNRKVCNLLDVINEHS